MVSAAIIICNSIITTITCITSPTEWTPAISQSPPSAAIIEGKVSRTRKCSFAAFSKVLRWKDIQQRRRSDCEGVCMNESWSGKALSGWEAKEASSDVISCLRRSRVTSSGWSGMVRDGLGWSGMVRDGPGWSGMVSLISLSYSMPVFSANSFGLFLEMLTYTVLVM